MKKKSIQAFTLVELIVTITILAILGTIGFISFSGYATSARDAVRSHDMGTIVSVFEYSVLQTGTYPTPDGPNDITFSGSLAWTQGSFGEGAKRAIRGVNEVPTDPLTGQEYTYSLHNNGMEYELGGVSEELTANIGISNQTFADIDTFRSVIRGNYNGVGLIVPHSTGNKSILALPTIIASDVSNSDLEAILSSRRLSYNGEPCYGHTYGGNLVCGTLVNPNRSIFEAYSGSLANLSTSKDSRTQLLKNIQNAYFGTNVTLSTELEKLKDTTILLSEPSDEAYLLANETAEYSFGLKIQDEEEEPVDPYTLTFTSSDYNSNWTSNSCTGDISVIYVNPGEENSTIRSLATNTVYVLSEGTYTMTAPINMDNCSAIIGLGDVEIKSDRYITEVIALHGKSNVIVDNVSIDGINGTVAKNLVGIDITTLTSNSTIKNVSTGNLGRGLSIDSSNNISVYNLKTFNNSQYGYYLGSSEGVISEDIRSYNTYSASGAGGGNNGTGIYLINSSNNYFDNILSYNNSWHGILLGDASDYNAINNGIVYSNGGRGTFIHNGNNNVISNVSHYQNASKELEISSNTLSNNNIINNSSALAASWNGIISASTTTKYYGNMYTPIPTPHANITRGTGHLVLTDGVIPVTSLTLSTDYMALPSGTWSDTINGRQGSVSLNEGTTYTYGIDIAHQNQPVKYNGTTLENFGSFDASKKIGEW